MADRILLWPGEAPYAAQSPGQAAPSIAAYPAAGAPTAVVVCPGGGYSYKAEHEGGPIAQMLNRGGISAYVLDYRVHPCHPMAPLADAARAIRTVRQMGYRHVGILGFSAGGNLCCNAAVHWDGGDPDSPDPVERLSSRPDFFVPCYPVVSFTAYAHYDSFLKLVGAPDRHDLERYFSAELNVTADTPPAFIWHTADDEAVPVQNSLMLAWALSRCGVPYELHIYPSGPHGLGLAEDYPEVRVWADRLVEFIQRRFFDRTQRFMPRQ